MQVSLRFYRFLYLAVGYYLFKSVQVVRHRHTMALFTLLMIVPIAGLILTYLNGYYAKPLFSWLLPSLVLLLFVYFIVCLVQFNERANQTGKYQNYLELPLGERIAFAYLSLSLLLFGIGIPLV